MDGWMQLVEPHPTSYRAPSSYKVKQTYWHLVKNPVA
jgi:hypothetical protein